MKLKKLKIVFRIFFPKKFTDLELLHKKINKNNNIHSLVAKNKCYEVTFQNKTKLIVRDQTHSDAKVFNQIFNDEEYALIKKLMGYNSVFNEQKIIIDAGANVGYTTYYLSMIFNKAKVFAVEPSADNAQMILENIKSLPNKKNIKVYQKALSHQSGMSFSIDRTFRDGQDWSIATQEDVDGEITGISIQEIIIENRLTHISLLKIDIEGAERFIFKPGNDFSFLKITEIIAIEIHDEFDIRKSINEILISNDFIIFESGELTIGLNRNFIK
jgi:FkbM family methyltransferase